MKNRILCIVVAMVFVISTGLTFKSNQFKCLIQLSNYDGEGAYVVVSLLDSHGDYQKTLYVFGKEKRWYDDIPSWWQFFSNSGEKLDAISGASISPGSRKVISLSFSEEELNSGYILRFESAVENKKYQEQDMQMELNASNVGNTQSGVGYIRYVKLIKV
jgi:hypothetical protein